MASVLRRSLLVCSALLLAVAAGVLAVRARGSTARPTDAVAPWVHQQGTSFVDASGRPVLLRGANVTPDQTQDFAQAVALHANFVRIPIKWSLVEPAPPQGPAHTYNPARLAQLDDEVKFYAAHKINVLLDFHQSRWSSYFSQVGAATRPNPNDQAGIPSWLYAGGPYPPTGPGRAAAEAAFYSDPTAIDDFSSFVQMIVDRYRSYPNVVGYEILNEPQTGALPSNHATTQLVIGWEAKILDVIRAEDPLRTVFFMLRGGGDLGIKQADLTPLAPLRNLALDLHDYYAGTSGDGYSVDGENRATNFVRTSEVANYTGTVASQRAYLETVLAKTSAWNIPLLVGEWGVPRNDPARAVYQSQMLSLFTSLKVNWTRWNLDRSHQFGLLDDQGNLNDNGLQIAQYLASTSAGAPAEGVLVAAGGHVTFRLVYKPRTQLPLTLRFLAGSDAIRLRARKAPGIRAYCTDRTSGRVVASPPLRLRAVQRIAILHLAPLPSGAALSCGLRSAAPGPPRPILAVRMHAAS